MPFGHFDKFYGVLYTATPILDFDKFYGVLYTATPILEYTLKSVTS